VAAISILLTTGEISRAEDSDLQAAVGRYHRAIEARDLSKMAPLWEHNDHVILVNPVSTAVAVGWPAVERNWRLLFDAFRELKLTQMDGPHMQIRGDIALSTGIVSADIKLKSGASVTEATFETAVFEKGRDGWLLISHVASTVPRFAD
jgi:ketosteroid isomerase-like protein